MEGDEVRKPEHQRGTKKKRRSGDGESIPEGSHLPLFSLLFRHLKTLGIPGF